MDTLSLLGNSSLALLHTIKSHPSPFPPPPQPTRSNKLATLRAEHAQLHQQLQQAHIAAVATRKAALALAAAAELQQPVEQRERQLKQRVQELKVQVEEQQGRSQVRQGIVNALNHSLTINARISRTSDSPAAAERDSTLSALLAKRDRLALELLAEQRRTQVAQRERVDRRKRLLALNRINAAHTAELKLVNAEPERQAMEGMTREEKKEWDRLKASTTRQLSGHAIIRNVFQLVVVESGVPWYSGEDVSALYPDAEGQQQDEQEQEDDVDAPMDTKRLMKLMLQAGDGQERGWERRAVAGNREGQGRKRGR